MYGTLTCYLGPMFAGKSTSLLQNIVWFKYIDEPIMIFKPSYDKRYSDKEIVTHNGVKILSEVIDESKEALNNESYDKLRHVFFDEIHFFDSNIIDVVKTMLKESKNVYISGLDCDYNGEPFYVSSILSGMADYTYKVKATCNVCGKPASKTIRINSNVDNSYVLGSTDKYEARCNEHFFDK